jgi:hypothetical protein
MGRTNVREICFGLTIYILNIIGNRSGIWKEMICFGNSNNWTWQEVCRSSYFRTSKETRLESRPFRPIPRRGHRLRSLCIVSVPGFQYARAKFPRTNFWHRFNLGQWERIKFNCIFYIATRKRVSVPHKYNEVAIGLLKCGICFQITFLAEEKILS